MQSNSKSNSEDTSIVKSVKEIIEQVLNRLNFAVEAEIFEDQTYQRTSDFYIQIYRELFKKLSIENENFLDNLEDLPDAEALQYQIDKLAADIVEISLAHIRGENMINGDMETIFNFQQLTHAILQTTDVEEQSGEQNDADYEFELNKSSSKNKKNSSKIDQKPPHTDNSKKNHNIFDDENNILESENMDILSKLEKESGIKQTDDPEIDIKKPKELEKEQNPNIDNPTYYDDKLNYKSVVNMSNNVKDQNSTNINNNSFNKLDSKGKGVKDSLTKVGANSRNSAQQLGQPKDITNLEKRYSEDVDDRGALFMKPKYKKHKPKPKSGFCAKNRIGGNLTEGSSGKKDGIMKKKKTPAFVDNGFQGHGQIDFSNLNIDEDDILDEELLAINDMARGRYGSNEQIDDILQKQRKKYRHQLKDYMRHLKTMDEVKEGRVTDAKQRNCDNKFRSMQIFEEKIQKEVENTEQSSKLRMRDRRANYERSVMKIVFALKKQNAITDKKIFKEQKDKRMKDTGNIMGSIENFYKDRITLLKEQMVKERQVRKVAEYAQRKMLSELERDLRKEKRSQMQEIVQKSMQERDKYDNFVINDVGIEDKLQKIFKYNAQNY